MSSLLMSLLYSFIPPPVVHCGQQTQLFAQIQKPCNPLQSTEAGGHILNEQVSGGELPGFLGTHQPSFLPAATQSFGQNMILEKKKNFKVLPVETVISWI